MFVVVYHCYYRHCFFLIETTPTTSVIDDMNTEKRSVQAIMFADIAGSAALYEKIGDKQASQLITACMKSMAGISSNFYGNVIKTIGDEVMCSFMDTDQALMAAKKIIEKIPSKFRDYELSVHIGLGYGKVTDVSNDIYGDSINLTARIVSLAKAGEILASESFFQNLHAEHQRDFVLFDKRHVKGKKEVLKLYKLYKSSTATFDQTVFMSVDQTFFDKHYQLVLRFGNDEITVNQFNDRISLGRNDDCDICIDSPLVSRIHAYIEYRSEKFLLVDQSTNGTRVQVEDNTPVRIRREQFTLMNRGLISLGQDFKKAISEHLIRFELET